MKITSVDCLKKKDANMNFLVEKLKALPLKSNEILQGGIIELPIWLNNQETNKPYRACHIVWTNPENYEPEPYDLLTKGYRDYSKALEGLVDLLYDKTKFGFCPGRLQVCDEGLADYLREHLSDTGITVDLLEKLDFVEFFKEKMEEYLKSKAHINNWSKTKGITVDVIRSFADAAAEFYNAAPWKHLDATDVIMIDKPFVDAGLRFVSIESSKSEGITLSFYRNLKEYENIKEGIVPNGSMWKMLYTDITHMPLNDANIWMENNLPVANSEAYPTLCEYIEKKTRRAGPDIAAFMEGLLRALAQSTEKEFDQIEWEKTVSTFRGEETYKLSLPCLKETQENSKETFSKKGIPDRRALEKIHTDIQRMLDGHNFDSIEQVQNFLNKNIVGKPLPEQTAITPHEQGQDIIFQAMETNGRRQMQLIKKALETDPDCVDAYVLLAERAHELSDAAEYYLKGVQAGERALGKKVFKEDVGHFWGIIQTRPYMRAKFGLAQTLEDMGKLEKAIEHYKELLRLNPNDNQGVRHTLAPCLIRTGKYQQADELLEQYSDDKYMALWNYLKAFICFKQQGDTKKSQKYLKTAIEKNMFVPDYILNDTPFPTEFPKTYSPGSIQEAIFCADRMLDIWEEDEEALDWFDMHRPKE